MEEKQKRIKPERMDHLIKGAEIGRPKEIKMKDEALRHVGWSKWTPTKISARRRPGGIIALYKTSLYFKIFNDSFEELKGGPGFVDKKPFKFITFYYQKKYQRLGFQLRGIKVEGALELHTIPPDGFQVGIKEILKDLNYEHSDITCYFKVKYDPVGKVHFINFGQPDFILTPGRTFAPFVPTKKERDLSIVHP